MTFHKPTASENLQPGVEEFSIFKDISQKLLHFKQPFLSFLSLNTLYTSNVTCSHQGNKSTNLDTHGGYHHSGKKSSHTQSTPFPKCRVHHPKHQQCSLGSLYGTTSSRDLAMDEWHREFILSQLWLPSPPHQGGSPKAWERWTSSHKNQRLESITLEDTHS